MPYGMCGTCSIIKEIGKMSEFYMINRMGIATPDIPRRGNDMIKTMWDGLYRYSKTTLRKIKECEFTCISKARAYNENLFFLTLTFPIELSNDSRQLINLKIADLCRKRYPTGGMWITELHSGIDEPLMKGKFHFHYFIITSQRKYEVLSWVRRQQDLRGMATNSFDVKAWVSNDEGYMYAYSSKKTQKDISTRRRIWAKWGLDTTGLEVDEQQLQMLNPRVINEHGLVKVQYEKISDLIEIKKKQLRNGAI